MAKKRNAAAGTIPAAQNDDPTLQTQEIAINGKVYTLCLDMRSLAKAERELRAAGNDVNILFALPGHTLNCVLTMFAAGIRRFHPEISYADALEIPGPVDVYKLHDAINQLWAQSIPTKDESAEKNPTQPGS